MIARINYVVGVFEFHFFICLVCLDFQLTSLVSGLMSRLWCRKPDPTYLYVLTKQGPLVSFHSFLTYHAHEAEMFSDMIVAIEDLRTVEFVMILHSGSRASEGTNVDEDPELSVGPDFPIPRVMGSRSSLKVLLPVPESVFSLLPMYNGSSSRSTSFVVTPVFFNIGINEHASYAERFKSMEPQDRSNMDSFMRLSEYHRHFRKLNLPVKYTSKR